MPIRKTASGGQVTGVEHTRRVERVHSADHPEGVTIVFPEDPMRRQASAGGWTADDELGLEVEDSRD